jgi:hypothetical protein
MVFSNMIKPNHASHGDGHCIEAAPDSATRVLNGVIPKFQCPLCDLTKR